MNKLWRKLDNTAKIFSLDVPKYSNTYRLSASLKEKIDPKILKEAVILMLEIYPSFKVKIKSGCFWSRLQFNPKEPIVEEVNENTRINIDYKNNNDYLFKVTYFNKKINIDVFHVLTDGVGAIILLKAILYHYLNLKYKLDITDNGLSKDKWSMEDQYLKKADKKLVCQKNNKKAFLITENSNFNQNKTYHYIIDLNKFKSICKENKVSITEYLMALYIYGLYKTLYDKKIDKDIVITVPIDLRSHYGVQTVSNFFTYMNINSNVLNKKNISFHKILNQVHEEFKNKLTKENIKKYLARDVKLGTNIAVKYVPLFIKKTFIKYFGKVVNQSSTTTLSNIGPIIFPKEHKKYIENVIALVRPGAVQKVKCTVCSYENNLTVTINSNLSSNKFEKEFYKLLIKHIGKIKLESSII